MGFTSEGELDVTEKVTEIEGTSAMIPAGSDEPIKPTRGKPQLRVVK
jgi:hypothetical protein